MSAGDVAAHDWRDWIGALRTIHAAADVHAPAVLHRVAALDADLDRLGDPRPVAAAAAYAAALTAADAPGAVYVLGGAGLMGGAVIERRVGLRLPCEHLRWQDRRAALDAWRPLRARGDQIEAARACFAALLACMDEIEGMA